MAASIAGNVETVKVLLQHGASLDLTDVRTYVTSECVLILVQRYPWHITVIREIVRR